ncbi:hypothetical protein FQN53_006109 [Emmonsiellopsis sp. PD_33]|nr:hypothetical protein FQN53_006109 [Emmonsiellopsis sp. PD_33]
MIDVGTQIDLILSQGSSGDAPNTSLSGEARMNAYENLHFFVNSVSDIALTSVAFQRVVKGSMIRVALQTPYLLHAILAISTYYKAKTLPNPSHNNVHSTYHISRATQLYRSALNSHISQNNMDGIISASMLVADFTFFDEDYSPYNSFVFSSDPSALNWVLMQSALSHILPKIQPWLHNCIWFVPFMEAYSEYCEIDTSTPGADGLQRELAELCEIDEESTAANNPYHSALRTFTSMVDIEVSGPNFIKLMFFLGSLRPSFTRLLQKRESRALLILAFWLGKMCEDPAGWIYPKLHMECLAICMYLDGNQDQRVTRLLEYPARKCGYTLRQDIEPDSLVWRGITC